MLYLYINSYRAANLIICLLISSDTHIIHWTVYCCWRRTKKHCFPFARLVCSLALTQTSWPFNFVDNIETSINLYDGASFDWFIGAFPYFPEDISGVLISSSPSMTLETCPSIDLCACFLALFSAFLASRFNCFSDFSLKSYLNYVTYTKGHYTGRILSIQRSPK